MYAQAPYPRHGHLSIGVVGRTSDTMSNTDHLSSAEGISEYVGTSTRPRRSLDRSRPPKRTIRGIKPDKTESITFYGGFEAVFFFTDCKKA